METFSALLVICSGNSPGLGKFPAQRQVTRSLGVFFDLHLNKRLCKQSWGWLIETLSVPLWRHSKGYLSPGPLWHRQLPCNRGGGGGGGTIMLNSPHYVHIYDAYFQNNHWHRQWIWKVSVMATLKPFCSSCFSYFLWYSVKCTAGG